LNFEGLTPKFFSKSDPSLAKTKRMDNLICGDNSGFFKTGGDLENEEKYR